MDNTNIIYGKANWKYLKDVKIENLEYLNLSKNADTWRVYPMNVDPIVGNECSMLYPSKFEGLSYTIKGYSKNNVEIIETKDYGIVQIYIGQDISNMFNITKHPIYNLIK